MTGSDTRYITPDSILRNRFAANPPPSWKIAIVCFRSADGSTELLRLLGAKPLGCKVLWGMEEFPGNPLANEIDIHGCKIGVIARCNWGGPQAAIVVEELAALGVESIIGIGAAAGIADILRRGSQFVVTKALRTDGTSRAYSDAASFACSDSLLQLVNSCAAEMGISLAQVTAATVDAIYRETEAMVETWASAGAQAINMEATPFYAAAQICGVAAIEIGHVSDAMAGGKWQPWDNLDAMTRESGRLALQVASKLAMDQGRSG